MARIDYFDDPDAPAITSVVPSVTVAVRDTHGDILLIHRTDNDLWALPGGGHDPGERIVDTAVREVKEETGIDIEITGLVGTYTDPRHVMQYDDGEVRQQFSLCFTARYIGGTAREDDVETRAVAWVDPATLDELSIHPSMRLRIDHALGPHRALPGMNTELDPL
jgi:ADP-ribose pyrophosphatase YjhB (NUDIX family)